MRQPSAIRQRVGLAAIALLCPDRIPSGLGDRVSEFCCADWRVLEPGSVSSTAEPALLMRNSKGVYGGCSGSLVVGGLRADSRHCLTDALVVDIYFGTEF